MNWRTKFQPLVCETTPPKQHLATNVQPTTVCQRTPHPIQLRFPTKRSEKCGDDALLMVHEALHLRPTKSEGTTPFKVSSQVRKSSLYQDHMAHTWVRGIMISWQWQVTWSETWFSTMCTVHPNISCNVLLIWCSIQLLQIELLLIPNSTYDN